MTRVEPTDDALRVAYEQLLQRRSEGSPPDISLDLICALAEGSYVGPDLSEQLERVLSHPATAQEFHVLRAVASPRTRRSFRGLPVWVGVAAAAAVILVVGRWAPSGRDGIRAGTLVDVIVPGEGAPWGRGVFQWHAVPDAASYHFEVLNADAMIVDSVTTGDTSVVRSVPTDTSSTPWSWSVVARRGDGTSMRSVPRQLHP